VNSGPTLSIGSTGSDVRRLQILFVMAKELDVSDIDSDFGPKTRDAVKSFQQANNLTPDGVVGPMTWQALPADPNTPRLARGSMGPAYPHCKRDSSRSMIRTHRPTLARLMGTLVREQSQPCVPIKRDKV